jgi:hypothetical protein
MPKVILIKPRALVKRDSRFYYLLEAIPKTLTAYAPLPFGRLRVGSWQGSGGLSG